MKMCVVSLVKCPSRMHCFMQHLNARLGLGIWVYEMECWCSYVLQLRSTAGLLCCSTLADETWYTLQCSGLCYSASYRGKQGL